MLADGFRRPVTTRKPQQRRRPRWRISGAQDRRRTKLSLDYNDGFVQMAFDLSSDDAPFDASRWAGIELDVCGNGETYEVRLRTSQLSKPWHSFRAAFQASRHSKILRMPFCDFAAHRHDLPFDPAHLRRIGVLATGRAFQADVAVSALRLYR